MFRLTVVAVLLASLTLVGCSTTSSGGSSGDTARQRIDLPQGEFERITVSGHTDAEVHCPDCNKNFPVRLVRGEAKGPREISVPGGEQWGGIPDTFDATVECEYCKKKIDVRVYKSHKH